MPFMAYSIYGMGSREMIWRETSENCKKKYLPKAGRRSEARAQGCSRNCRFRNCAKRKNLTQAELAKALEISDKTARFEAGTSR